MARVFAEANRLEKNKRERERYAARKAAEAAAEAAAERVRAAAAARRREQRAAVKRIREAAEEKRQAKNAKQRERDAAKRAAAAKAAEAPLPPGPEVPQNADGYTRDQMLNNEMGLSQVELVRYLADDAAFLKEQLGRNQTYEVDLFGNGKIPMFFDDARELSRFALKYSRRGDTLIENDLRNMKIAVVGIDEAEALRKEQAAERRAIQAADRKEAPAKLAAAEQRAAEAEQRAAEAEAAAAKAQAQLIAAVRKGKRGRRK
jgi:hypothetical protein